MIASSLLYGLLATASMGVAAAASPKKQIKYEVVTGIFRQDDPATDPATFDFIASNFGLINRTYPSDPATPDRKYATQWQRLDKYIRSLNKEKKTRYALLFMGRHGEGFHNAAESYFGTPAWNCHFAQQEGNDTVTWADAKLTSTGIAQARAVHTFWTRLLTEQKTPPPQSYYTSPLTRCLATADLSFANLPLPHGAAPFKPVVKELLREGITSHTCNRRRERSVLASEFPGFTFEKGFPEEDPLWRPLTNEPAAAQDARSRVLLDDVFSNDDATYISFTAHSGEITSLLRVLNHRPFRLATGSAIPVLVKQTTVSDGEPAKTVPWVPQQTCAVPPTIRDASCNDCSCCL